MENGFLLLCKRFKDGSLAWLHTAKEAKELTKYLLMIQDQTEERFDLLVEQVGLFVVPYGNCCIFKLVQLRY